MVLYVLSETANQKIKNKMEKNHNMKLFIAAAAEYSRHPSETSISVLQRNLNVIATSTDLSIFDPGSMITAEFYVSLYNLTKSLDSLTPLKWSALDVLQHASKNSAARQALIHTYKFAPILARMLETNLIPEKRIRVLKLLQELTYGVKIHWQEAHLPSLMTNLTQWIMTSKVEELVTLSLGVLINLCYKNFPAIYTLMRSVDTKALHRRLLKLQSNDVNTRVQCCKILMIMEHENKDIPEKFIFDFVDVTFHSLASALSKKDESLLRHIVEFFEDFRQNERTRSVLISYSNYANEVKNILDQLGNTSNLECSGLVIEFLLSLVKLKLSGLVPLYQQCIEISMKMVPIELLSSKSLALIKLILMDSRRSKNISDLLTEIDLSTLMLAVGSKNDGMEEVCESRSIEKKSTLIELLQLFQELNKVPNFRGHIIQAFTEQSMKTLFRPILREDIDTESEWPGNLFQNSSISLYINALSLTADLAVQNSNWLTLYSELIQKKQIQMIMALAVFTGDSEIKQKTLQLMSSVGFPQECVSLVSKCMVEFEPLILIQNRTGITTIKHQNTRNMDMTPFFSVAQEGQLDMLMSKLKEAFDENKIEDVTTSTIMELYEYKLSSMRHVERSNQENLETANIHVAGLQHRLSQIVAESSRLHQLIFYKQQNLERLKSEKIRLNQKLHETELESKKIHRTQKQEIQGLKKIITEKSNTIEQLSELEKDLKVALSKVEAQERRIKDLEIEVISLKNEGREMGDKNKEFSKVVTKLQDSVTKRDEVIRNKVREIEACQDSMSALKQENEGLIRTCRSYEQTISEKEENANRMAAELIDLSRMRDMIYQLTAKKKDETNEKT